MGRVNTIPLRCGLVLNDYSFVTFAVRIPGTFKMSPISKSDRFEDAAFIYANFVNGNPVDWLLVRVELVIERKNKPYARDLSSYANSNHIHIAPICSA